MDYLLIQVLNGVQLGLLMFLLAAGLTLTFGIMDLVNLAHGSLYMMGAYIAWTLIGWTDSFVLGALLAVPATFLLGIVVEHDLQTFGSGEHVLIHTLGVRQLVLSPPATRPQRMRNVACLELDPHPGARLGHRVEARAGTRERLARQRPARRHLLGDHAADVVIEQADDEIQVEVGDYKMRLRPRQTGMIPASVRSYLGHGGHGVRATGEGLDSTIWVLIPGCVLRPEQLKPGEELCFPSWVRDRERVAKRWRREHPHPHIPPEKIVAE